MSAQRATELLAEAANLERQGSTAHAGVLTAMAQTHATLALAAEQRLANMISQYQALVTLLVANATEGEALERLLSSMRSLEAQITEGLGL